MSSLIDPDTGAGDPDLVDKEIWAEGVKARRMRREISENPHPDSGDRGSRDWIRSGSWRNGWLDEDARLLESTKEGGEGLASDLIGDRNLQSAKSGEALAGGGVEDPLFTVDIEIERTGTSVEVEIESGDSVADIASHLEQEPRLKTGRHLAVYERKAGFFWTSYLPIHSVDRLDAPGDFVLASKDRSRRQIKWLMALLFPAGLLVMMVLAWPRDDE